MESFSQEEVFATALFDSAVTPQNPWGNETKQGKARQGKAKKTWSCKTNGIISRNKMNLLTAPGELIDQVQWIGIGIRIRSPP